MAPPNFGVELVIGPSWQRVPDEQSTIVQVEGSPYRIPYSGLVLSEAVIGEIAGVMLQPLWTDALDLVIAIGGGGSWGGDIENRFVGAHWRANLGVQWRPWPSAGLEALVRYHGGYTQGVEQEYTFFH
ncbi:MAG: hypothetical protein HY543_06045, partial [Deltaproteobacteria bacterium]|nr:hypothetical protein [Deltaproteobacteria bacterium]